MARPIQLERPARTEGGAVPLPSRFAIRHYSVAEIGELWNLSPDAVRKIFEKEPGVLVLGNAQHRLGKRRYTTLRIPEDVLERVYRRLSRV